MNSQDFIDRVAHDMTDVAPHTDLRAAVLARLEDRPRIPWKHTALPAIAAGVAIAAVVMTQTSREITEPQPVSAVATSAPQTLLPSNGELPQTTAARRKPALVPMSADEVAWHARAVPALVPAAPIAVESIQPTPIQIAPITVEPLAIDPLALPDVSSKAGDREREY